MRRFDPDDDKWDRRALFEITGIRMEENDFLESDTSDEELLTKVLVVLLAWHISLSSHLLEVDIELVHAIGWHLYPIVPDNLANWSD